jgi:hypothetical protein
MALFHSFFKEKDFFLSSWCNHFPFILVFTLVCINFQNVTEGCWSQERSLLFSLKKQYIDLNQSTTCMKESEPSRLWNKMSYNYRCGQVALCALHCELCTVYSALCIVHCALCTGHCVLCTVHCVLCTVYCVLCTVYCELCTVYRVLCTVYCVLFTVYCVLCTIYSVLCTVKWGIDEFGPSIVYELIKFVHGWRQSLVTLMPMFMDFSFVTMVYK